MIGINSWAHDPGDLKKVMAKEKLTWRTFDDDGSINRQWNRPATPAYYLIDHEGIIRYKWVGRIGDTAINAALSKLISEAERSVETP